MSVAPAKITLKQWEERYALLQSEGLVESSFGGSLTRHVEQGGNLRLTCMEYDNSVAALELWNFLLTEEDRLHEARDQGRIIVGTMKDLGTVPVMAYSLPNVTAFYPDGAWWLPCAMQLSAGLLAVADSLGIDESFCPVRAMLGAFLTEAHFPIPDLLICSVGAICDDFSAIAQCLNGLGYPIFWWEIPHRRQSDPLKHGEFADAALSSRTEADQTVGLPGGFIAPREQVDFVKRQLERVAEVLETVSGEQLTEERIREGIREANRI
ncbi:MAG TPA: 2-hydroxyacyl-CoA dehydratase family protein, partial [bacterium]|nr:2-hydroxyacyl-CoA dehydratase family protein [bacterium]